MSLGLTLRQSHRLELRCRTCGRSHSDDEKNNCPLKLRDEVIDKAERWRCPSPGCRGLVQVNADDHLQCRRCAARFSNSEVSNDADAKRVLIYNLIPKDTYQWVLTMKGLGKKRGPFKVDVMVKQLEAQAKAMRKQRREELRGE